MHKSGNHFFCVFLFMFSFYGIGVINAIRQYSKQDVLRLREEVREMFQHAYDGYVKYAYPYDELRPLSCDGTDTWGSYSLTLVDALDTLAIMGNYSEFRRVVDIVSARENFDANINVSVFETNIRLVGGLLSAHLLSRRAGAAVEPGWPCNGPLLRLAEDAAQRLMAAFDTPTGMPYGTVNLRSGVPRGETSVTCTAGVGTFVVEFGALSRLTGDPLYEEVAVHALRALYDHRSPIGLLGNHVDVLTGRWVAQDAGIGAGVDSYFEYLVKGATLFQKPELMDMFNEGRAVVDKYLKKDDWYVWASMTKGQVTLPVFQSLEAYWPGVLSLIGESDTAMRIIQNYHSVWRQYGFTPEVYNIGAGGASGGRESYPLRPELAESLMYLYRATRDPVLLQMGEDVLRSIQHSAKTGCGYATIKDVRDHRREDRMESFFLAETTKYLYLLFDPDNFIHNSGHAGAVVRTRAGECVVDAGGYVFNTEAHPIDPAALHCCHTANKGIDLHKVNEFYESFRDDETMILQKYGRDTEENDSRRDRYSSNSPTEGAPAALSDGGNDDSGSVKNQEAGSDRSDVDGESAEFVEEIVADGDPGMTRAGSDADRIRLADDVGSRPGAEETLRLERDRSPAASVLPAFVHDFLASAAPAKAECEPQVMLERIRRERLYHPRSAAQDYRLLRTPAPSFLRRVSLGGEFVIVHPYD